MDALLFPGFKNIQGKKVLPLAESIMFEFNSLLCDFSVKLQYF